MDIRIRVDDKTDAHVFVSLFGGIMNSGGLCGTLTLSHIEYADLKEALDGSAVRAAEDRAIEEALDELCCDENRTWSRAAILRRLGRGEPTTESPEDRRARFASEEEA